MERTKPKRNVNPWTAFLQPAQALQEDLVIAKLRSHLRLDRYARPRNTSFRLYIPALPYRAVRNSSLIGYRCVQGQSTHQGSVNKFTGSSSTEPSKLL